MNRKIRILVSMLFLSSSSHKDSVFYGLSDYMGTASANGTSYTHSMKMSWHGNACRINDRSFARGMHHIQQWRHNGSDPISNHRRIDCLLNCLFMHRSRKTPKMNVSIWWRHNEGPVMRTYDASLLVAELSVEQTVEFRWHWFLTRWRRSQYWWACEKTKPTGTKNKRGVYFREQSSFFGHNTISMLRYITLICVHSVSLKTKGRQFDNFSFGHHNNIEFINTFRKTLYYHLPVNIC